MQSKINRRSFFGTAAALALTPYFFSSAKAQDKPNIQGFDETYTNVNNAEKWEPFTDRKLRIGIAGYGVCKFGAAFALQDHPNAEVVGVADLFPDRCAELAKACRCEKTYPSLEEMIKDDSIEAVFIATDAPSHCDLAIKSLKAGKSVASAVPAVYGNLEDADRLYETVKETGLKYCMFETSAFHDDVYAARKIYAHGGFGQMVYSEGEYFHYYDPNVGSYNNWRVGIPPQFYPTHSNAYYTCVTGGSFVSVSCVGHKSKLPWFQPGANAYDNLFGSEYAMFETSEGGAARMAVSWDTAGWSGEIGRMRGEIGAMNGSYAGLNDDANKLVATLGDLRKPALPPTIDAGHHGGSSGYLGCDFIESLLKNKHPLVNVSVALNTTVSGIVAHMSALKDGEQMKIPQYAPL